MRSPFLQLMAVCSLLLLSFSSPENPSLKRLYENYLQALERCGDCLTDIVPGGDIYRVNQLKGDLEQIQVSPPKKEQKTIAYDLLETLIDLKLSEILQAKVEHAAPDWNDTRLTNDLETNIENRLFKWERRYASKQGVWDELSKLDEGSKVMVVEMAGGRSRAILDEQFFEKQVWPRLDADIKGRIAEAEAVIYEHSAPDRTFAQLEAFLNASSYATRYFNGRLNSKSEQAFFELFCLYTADGELTTFNDFEAFVLSKNLDSWKTLFSDLSKRDEYVAAQQIAAQGNTIVNSNQYDVTALKRFIPKAAPREIAFVALQKLTMPMVENERYGEAVKIVEEYQDVFVGKPLYHAIDRKYRNYLNALRKLQAGESKMHISTPLPSHVNSSGDEQRFIFSKENNYMALAPVGNQVKVFKRNVSGGWESIGNESCNSLNEYFFTNSPVQAREGQIEARSRDFAYTFGDISRQFTSKTNTDFSISYRHGVAFFVSSSPYERRAIVSTEAKEYNSPWNIHDGVSLQTSTNSRRFRGKVNGNGNTDIYYMTTRDNGLTWSKPKHLGNLVNTPFSERSPVLSEDGSTLYFSSEGHGGLGGYDVFKVAIRIEGTSISVMGDVQHILAACSTKDDLFYQVLFEGDTNEEVYFSSNRNGDFDVFLLKKSASSANDGANEPSYHEESFLPDWPGEKLLLELICDTFPAVRKVTPPGMVKVRGRIYDSKGRLIKSGRISFTNLDAKGPTHEITEEEEGKYDVLLKENTKYDIVITAVTVEGDLVSEFLNERIEICPQNSQQTAYAHKDFQTNEIQKMQENEEPTGFDFFFNTNKYVTSISNLEVIKTYYISHLRDLQSNPKVRIKMIGYADIRGTDEHNLTLSRNRVNTASRYMSDWGFSSGWLKTDFRGKTEKFSNERFDDLREILDKAVFESLFNYPGQERRWLLNRRVHMIFML
jgi:outer membrane protein OmpA-like peptidoglycan-associated protein